MSRRPNQKKARRRISSVPHSKDGVSFDLPLPLSSILARKYWEKRPLLIKRPFPQPLIQPKELFRALVAASERFRAGDETVPLRFYIEQAQQVADVGKFLPRRSDISSLGYSARIKRMLRGRTHALYAEDIQMDSPEIWLRFREFLRALGDRIDLEQAEIKATAFVGDYRFTPPGLHRGQSGNFKFVVDGTKRMLLWPDAFFRTRKNVNHTSNYECYRGSAIILEGKPGDVIYWPSDQWHVGECVDGASASVSLAIFAHSTSSAWSDLWNQISGFIEDERAVPSPSSRYERWPALKKRARKAMTAGLASARFRESLSATALNRLTSTGFSKVPAARTRRSLAKDAVIQGDPDFPIRWRRCGTADLVCSANGHAFAIKANPSLVKVVRRLNRGGPCRLSNLISECGPTSDPRALVEKLFALRAISRVTGIPQKRKTLKH